MHIEGSCVACYCCFAVSHAVCVSFAQAVVVGSGDGWLATRAELVFAERPSSLPMLSHSAAFTSQCGAMLQSTGVTYVFSKVAQDCCHLHMSHVMCVAQA